MPDLRAGLSLGDNAKTLVIIPLGAATLRKLERKLLDIGLKPTITRIPRRAVIGVEELDCITDRMDGWDLELDAETQQLLLSSRLKLEAHAKARKRLGYIQSPGTASKLLADFVHLKTLDDHQIVSVAAISDPQITGLCLFDEQGLGKTVQALFGFHRLKQSESCDAMLIFAPKNMVLEWAREAERFFPGCYQVIPVVGSEAEKRDALNRDGDIFVTNYETADRLKTRMQQLLRSMGGNSLLVVDESFFVKNPGARRTQAMKELRRQAGRCVVLCGTPAPNSPHDLVEQFNIADGGVTFQGIKIPEDREEATPIVRKAIEEKGVYLRRLKQDVLPDLPSKTFNRVLVPMEPIQDELYKHGLESLVERLSETDDSTFLREFTSFKAKRQTLLQLCSNPGNVADGYEEVPAKLLALDSVLEELVERRNEKVIVWSFYTRSLDAIFRRYMRYHPVRIDGTVTDVGDRREAVRKFQDDDITMLFVGNPAAAGAGLTLHRARYAVYESMSNQAAHYLQSLDRIHRRGQERDVEYVILLCDRTLEVTEYDRLIAKEEAGQALLGDVVEPPVTRQSMLDEAVRALNTFKGKSIPVSL